MREIKFRGMDLQGRWFYGNLAIVPKDTRDHKKGHYISNSAGMPFAYPVRPETVGQYTGLEDKNGTPIYEGDIVERDFPSLGRIAIRVVVYHSDGFRLKETGKFKGLSFLSPALEDIEVVGNIYEHPHLLKEA